jgi:hypothetical protein
MDGFPVRRSRFPFDTTPRDLFSVRFDRGLGASREHPKGLLGSTQRGHSPIREEALQCRGDQVPT